MQATPYLVFSRGKYRGRIIDFRTGHIIVKVSSRAQDPYADPSVINDIMGQIPFDIVGDPGNRWFYLRVDDGLDIPRLAETLNRDPRVRYAEPDLKLTASAEVHDPGDPLLYDGASPQQWGIGQLNLFEVWQTQQGNDSVLIGLIDSGLQLKAGFEDSIVHQDRLTGAVDHVDLDGSRFIAGNNFLLDPVRAWPHEDPGTSYVHGTNMAGIIAALENNKDTSGKFIGIAGINWHSPVYVTAAIDWGNNSTIGLVFLATCETLDFAATAEGKPNVVINLSVNYVDVPPEETEGPGQPGQPEWVGYPSPLETPEEQEIPAAPVIPPLPMDTMKEMFGRIVEADAVICISAGKGAPDSDGILIQHPAKLGVETAEFAPHVIAVGAIDRQWEIYQHSGRGIDDMVFAPGVEVATTDKNDGWDAEDGSSIATAHVSGLASLLWSEKPALPAAGIVASVKGTCQFPPGYSSNTSADPGYLSRGVVDARAALQEIMDLESP